MSKEIYQIEDIEDERVSVFTKFSEPQLLHYHEPKPGLFIAETPMVIERAFKSGATPVSFLIEKGQYESEAVQNILKLLAEDVEIMLAELSVIKNITGYNLTRGMLAAFRRPELPEVKTLLANATNVAVLEDVMNPTNVGAIFRSAAALGVDAILLTAGASDPYYRRAARVSVGTVFQVPWTYIPKDVNVAELLHEEGFSAISMALEKDAVPLNDPNLARAKRRAVVFGTEGTGIKRETLEKSDHIAVIPMHNGVDSLNVAASSAIAFWELCGRE